MKFTTIQNPEDKSIIAYFVDNKRVNRSKFLHLENLQWLRGGRYNSSVTTKTRKGNFRHVAYIN